MSVVEELLAEWERETLSPCEEGTVNLVHRTCMEARVQELRAALHADGLPPGYEERPEGGRMRKRDRALLWLLAFGMWCGCVFVAVNLLGFEPSTVALGLCVYLATERSLAALEHSEPVE